VRFITLLLILVLGTRGEELDLWWLVDEVGVFLLEALPLCILCQVKTIGIVKVHLYFEFIIIHMTSS
jgi:hypothetical protein